MESICGEKNFPNWRVSFGGMGVLSLDSVMVRADALMNRLPLLLDGRGRHDLNADDFCNKVCIIFIFFRN